MADEEAVGNQSEEEVDTSAEAVDEEKAELEKLKERIDVAVEDIGMLRKKVTVTIPVEAIDERKEEQYSELSREAVVPGFRKGRAPRRLLEKRFGHDVSETITSTLVGTGYLAAVEKTELKVLGDPLIWCAPKKPAKDQPEASAEKLMSVTEAMENIVLPDEGALTFSCEVEVRPEFELPTLEGIPLEKPKLSITDADVDQQVERYRGMYGRYEPVADGAIQADDLVFADLKSSADGKPLKTQENVQLAARPQTIDSIPLNTLGDVLVGAKSGDVRKISGTAPDDFEPAELRGKSIDFELTIKEFRRLNVPELTEEMVKPMGFDSVDDFRQYIRGDMEARLAEMTRRHLRNQVYAFLLDACKLDLPERLSERQTNRMVIRRMLDLYRQGLPEAEVAKRMDELQTTAREEAARDLQCTLIMEKIAEELEPHVSEDEINGQIALIAQQQNRRFDRVRDDLIKNDGIQSLAVQLRDEKIVDQLIEKAAITETDAAEEKAAEKSKKARKPAKKKAATEKEAESTDET
ncbi:MAG: trigger factor [Phycisphaerae bacterium]|nr:trigger factor [Phycisphaerae bacterium]